MIYKRVEKYGFVISVDEIYLKKYFFSFIGSLPVPEKKVSSFVCLIVVLRRSPGFFKLVRLWIYLFLVKVVYSKKRIGIRVSLEFAPADLTEQSFKSFVTLVRFLSAQSLQKLTKANLVICDADTVFQPDFWGKVRELFSKDFDVALRVRNKKQPSVKYMAGFVAVKLTENSSLFLNNLNQNIKSTLRFFDLFWYDDQCSLFYSISGLKGLRVHEIAEDFATSHYQENAIGLWSPKGEDKVNIGLVARQGGGEHKKLPSKIDDLISFDFAGTDPRCVIFFPDLSLPFKKPNKFEPRLYENFKLKNSYELREYWKKFLDLIKATLDSLGVSYEVIIVPKWQIDKYLCFAAKSPNVYVPHHSSMSLGFCRPGMMFYMQVFFPWFFTIDKSGWGANASYYPVMLPNEADDLIDFSKVFPGKASKFDQPAELSRAELIRLGYIPEEKYIFFPLQVPDDESIRFGSDVDLVTVVEKLLQWSERLKIEIVFKPHPVNFQKMQELKNFFCDRVKFWSDCNIHDLIANSSAVYLINSGVGFEALQYPLPIVTFGRVDYDSVTIRGDVDNLDRIWSDVSRFSIKDEMVRRRRFLNEFYKKYLIDLRDSVAVGVLRERLLKEILL